jgi:hypothetical protein
MLLEDTKDFSRNVLNPNISPDCRLNTFSKKVSTKTKQKLQHNLLQHADSVN